MFSFVQFTAIVTLGLTVEQNNWYWVFPSVSWTLWNFIMSL